MVVILQPASRRPFSMLPVTIFKVMMNLIIVNRMQNRVTSCLFSFVVEFANGYKMGGGGGGEEKQ